jgi:hypothetical protein
MPKGDAPKFCMFPCSHGNTSFYEMGKKQGNKKRVVYKRNTIFQSKGFNKDLPCTKIAEIN